MKNSFFQALRIFIIFFFCSFFQVSFAASGSTTEPINFSKLDEIGTLLNHQNITAAKEKGDTLFRTISEEEILATPYENFLSIMDLYRWKNETTTVRDLIKKRWGLFPNEENLCGISVRYYGYLHPCTGNGSGAIFLDSIDYGLYLAQSGTGTNRELEKYMKGLVGKADNLQNKSDLGNLIGFYARKNPKRAFLFTSIQQNLGKEILKKDSAWVNGYLLLRFGHKDTSKMWKKIMQDLNKNFIGDTERLKQILDE